MPTSARLDTRLTYDDFVLFPDDGLRHEIIDGVHYVTPSPTRRHQRISRRLSFALESYLRAHPSAGEMFYAPFDVVMSNWDVVEPDLLVIAGDQQDILTEKNVQGAPALVIEILSPGTRTARRADQAPAVRADRRARVLAGRSVAQPDHGVSPRCRRPFSEGCRTDRSRWCGTHDPDPAGFPARARTPLRVNGRRQEAVRFLTEVPHKTPRRLPGPRILETMPDGEGADLVRAHRSRFPPGFARNPC